MEDKQKEKNVTWGKNEEYNITNFNDDEDTDNSIFRKLKKVPSNLENIILTMDETNIQTQIPVEERLLQIEKRLESYDNKIDKILYLLQGRENN